MQQCMPTMRPCECYNKRSEFVKTLGVSLVTNKLVF